jgi:hypothetical protein
MKPIPPYFFGGPSIEVANRRQVILVDPINELRDIIQITGGQG